MSRTRTSDLHDRLRCPPCHPPGQTNRTTGRGDRYHRDARKILTPNGVEQLEKVRIGGIDQRASIRGVDRKESSVAIYSRRPGVRPDPDELVVHPGLEEYFTVVQ